MKSINHDFAALNQVQGDGKVDKSQTGSSKNAAAAKKGNSMNVLEKKMADLLAELKKNYCVKAVKAEFESEELSFAQISSLRELAHNAGLEFTLKLGGCVPVRDFSEAQKLDVDNIVAPMIESRYAMEKFVNTAQLIFPPSDFSRKKLYINLETSTGVQNFDEIASSPLFEALNGVVFGRSDYAASILAKSGTDSDFVFEAAEKVARKTLAAGKELIVGGNVTALSLPFFKKLQTTHLSGFETRKIIFNAPNALITPHAEQGIQKALEFELLWLKNKNSLSILDKTRIETLEKRFLS